MILAFGDITEHIDLAQIALYLFWAFFFVLILYLLSEGRREGFPLVHDPDGTPLDQEFWMPKAKVFHTNDGRTKLAPDPATADTRELNAEWAAGGYGSPLVPLGNPMKDGLGAAAYYPRPDVPDMTHEHNPRVVPMRFDQSFRVAEPDIDPRGCPVFGCDGVKVGTVADIWVDRSDFVIRYLEVELSELASQADGSPMRVMVPWLMVSLKSDRDWLMEFVTMKWKKPNAEIHVGAVTAAQFADAPALANPDQVTMNEEELIQAYFGGGYLYATPSRQEPLI